LNVNLCEYVVVSCWSSERSRTPRLVPTKSAGERATDVGSHAFLEVASRVYEGRDDGAAMPPSVADALALVSRK
jgi:hypothetical protein